MRDCEYVLRTRTKPDLNYVVKCSLTGKTCFCDPLPQSCTRRTFALAYESKHQVLPPPMGADLGHITD
jgi:hypothetical protein